MLILTLLIFTSHHLTSFIPITFRLTLHRFTLHHPHAASPENQPDTLPFRFIRRSTAGSMSIPLFGEPLQAKLPQRTLLLIARFGFSVMLILTPLILTTSRLTLYRFTSFILITFRLTLHRLTLFILRCIA